jgi:4'-phosphopantetheinyl transferase
MIDECFPQQSSQASLKFQEKSGVTIVQCSLHVADDEFRALEKLLSEDEKERSFRRVHEVRRRAVVSRGRLRVLLGHLIGIAPEKVQLITGHFGKPYLSEVHQSGIQFNVAHSMDEAMVAISYHSAVGVDLEKSKRTHDQRWARLMAPTIFSENELSERSASSDTIVSADILDAWVAKEAVLKAAGTGIGDKLRKCQLPADLPKVTIFTDLETTSCRLAPVVLQDQSPSCSSRFGVTLVGLGEDTHVAIACSSLTCEITARSFDRVLRDSGV